jgi:predicted flap endonuclease-1-like 5' DNA nuclease
MDAAGPLALVVLGAIIGWVIELVVDFLILRPYWIAEGRQLAGTLPDEEVRAALREQTATLARLEALRAEENAAVTRLNAYLAEQSERPEPIDEALQSAVQQITDTLAAHVRDSSGALLEEIRDLIPEEAVFTQDRLADIKGIGPSYAGRLYEMGVHTFKQLAALSTEELATMINVRGRPKIDAESWIAQAKLFASGRAKAEEAS